MSVARYAKSTQNKYAVSFAISQEWFELWSWVMFCMLIDMKVFYKLIIFFLMGLARDAQSTQLNLQCLCDISRKKTGMKLGT